LTEQQVRSEFSEVQAMIKMMRSPAGVAEPDGGGAGSLARSLSRSVRPTAVF
jgi:hypothetical protein